MTLRIPMTLLSIALIGAFADSAQAGSGKSSKTFNEQKIVLSLAAMSDTHVDLNNANSVKFINALNQLKAKAAENDPDGIDGVMIAGDLINYGANHNQMKIFKKDYESVFDPLKVPLVYTIGNHDPGTQYSWFPDTPQVVGYIRDILGPDYFKTDLDNDNRVKYECRHCVIGNYHILCVTPDGIGPITYDPEVLKWLDEQLAAITKAEPEKYVIVVTHPMIYDTVYGSLLSTTDKWPWSFPRYNWYWSTTELTPILDKYPQAVTFSGHLHFPLNDPRSVWQGQFTAFGCGSVKYMSVEAGGYENMSGTDVMKDSDKFSQGLLIQFDANGNMRATRMDFYNNSTIGKPWQMFHPVKNLSHLKAYSNSVRKSANKAPVLTKLTVETGSNVFVKFAAGTDDEFVHHYIMTVSKDGKVVAAKKILTDFYLHPQPSQMKTEWSQPLGTMDPGKYTVSLTAYDSWDAASNTLKSEFNVSNK
jgi:hypothetical protein